MLLAAEKLPERPAGRRPGPDSGRKKAFLRAPLPLERVFHARRPQPIFLDGMDERFPGGYPDDEVYRARLEYELGIIIQMGRGGVSFCTRSCSEVDPTAPSFSNARTTS